MGYRNYIGRIKKNDITKLMLTMNREFRDEATEELYEIGKYYSSPENGFEVICDLSDTDVEYKVITKNSLRAIIKQFSQFHLDFLKSLTKTDDELTIEEKADKELGYLKNIKEYIQEQIYSWEKPEALIYDLDDPNRLVKSWNYQYAVIELVKIYKEFDDEEYSLVFMGH
jgi:hypothetical protein